MIRVGILGATGYTALELIKLLLRHPEAKLSVLTSRQEGRPHVSAVHPQLSGRLDLNLEDLSAEQVAEQVDCLFSCLPHAASAQAIMAVRKPIKIVDFSADYRLSDPASYQHWYGHQHPDPERLGKVVYGLPELFASEIAGQDLVANPGCYTSTSILALAPLLHRGLIEPKGIIIDAKSGVSGAGRTPKLTTLFAECNESLSAYSVGNHRHMPEIEQILSLSTKRDVQALFTPHLVPMDRGILCTIYARPTTPLTEDALLNQMRDFYADQPFVRVVTHLPATKDVAYTNYCDVTARVVRDQVIVLACLDNLIKGAAGVAVQNFNLMFGFPETMGIL